jgi:type 1 glutamine amidotransferase
MKRSVLGMALLAGMAASCAEGAESLPKVLFLTHSAGWKHSVVLRSPDGTPSWAEKQLQRAAKGRFEVVATQDVGEVTRERLKGYKAIVFYTTGELAIDKEALIDFVKEGGGFAGIHSATDTLYKYAPYGELVGGYFDGHPWHEKVTVRVEDTQHPATAHLGPSFEITDEIYQFRDWDRSKLHVLLSLDPARVDLAKEGVKRADKDFGLSWTDTLGKGRVFYTALGHREEVWADPRFLTHLVNGIAWTFGAAPPAKPAAATGEEGFTWLLQGAALPPGWQQAGPGGFKINNGVATAEGGMGLWYHAPKTYKDFVLRLEYRQGKPGANAGVFIRFPRVDGDPMVPVNEGYEIQIYGGADVKNPTGAVYNLKMPTEVPQKPAGEWNEMEIKAVGPEITVALNGKVINTYKGERSPQGMIGLQNHEDEVSFRNVRIKELVP